MDENEVQVAAEEVATAPMKMLWVTDGTDNLRLEESDVASFLSASPGWRRGRSGAFKKLTPDEPTTLVAPAPELTGPKAAKLFLINGLVRLEPLVANRAAAQAEQHRLVWAHDLEQAMQKYTKYFTDLGTKTERYVVLNMAASEAIF